MKKHFTSVISSIFGKFANKEFNSSFQNLINNSYVKLMGLDMSNFAPASSYKSLKDLFIRKLKQEPNIDAKIDSVISPCDSKVVAVGEIKEHTAYQIKGMEYDTNTLIGALENSNFLDGGSFCNFYLSPKDYHRYHMPFDVKVLSLTYIPGKLYPVNMPLLKSKKNLYLENERVVVEVIDRFGHKHFIVLVGALNVGKMIVTFEPRVKTNCGKSREHIVYEKAIEMKKGEMFGWFEMGSTIVMLSQKGAIEYNLSDRDSVKFADTIGVLKHDN